MSRWFLVCPFICGGRRYLCPIWYTIKTNNISGFTAVPARDACRYSFRRDGKVRGAAQDSKSQQNDSQHLVGRNVFSASLKFEKYFIIWWYGDKDVMFPVYEYVDINRYLLGSLIDPSRPGIREKTLRYSYEVISVLHLQTIAATRLQMDPL